MPDDDTPTDLPTGPDGVDDTPRITCDRCDRSWDLRYELDDLGVGNRAVEQFALDHHRHTGHFPDGVSTWTATCRRCPESVQRLDEPAARRWAETHARHTRHPVAIDHADRETITVDSPAGSDGGGTTDDGTGPAGSENGPTDGE